LTWIKKLLQNKKNMFKEFIKTLENYNRIGVFSHVRPDGDCVGSQVALCRWLEMNGYQAGAFNDDEIPMNLQWLTEYYPVNKPAEEDMASFDLIVLVDGNAIHRFGEIENWQKEQNLPIVIIDHHPDPERGFEVTVSVPKASSTCELIYRLYLEHNADQIDQISAKALYTGIITDTGSLQFDSVTPETVEIVADLLRRGKFKPNEIIERLYSTKTLHQYELLSRALTTINLFEDNQIAVMSVTQHMMDETHTSNADTEGFVNYPLSLLGVKVAVLFKDLEEDGIKMSLRSRSDIDVNIWARELGGGGHKKAAGAWHPGPLKKAIQETINIGKKQL
jgi:bifunctional oligoribonuclease and PAP phosphatase NrnA